MKPIIIENFIDKEEIDCLLKNINKINVKENNGISQYWETLDESFISSQLFNNIDVYELIYKNYNKIKLNIENSFNIKVSLKRFFFQTMDEGCEIPLHVDILGHYNYDRVTTKIYSAILYLNNDYQGGEIVFPLEDVTLKPNAGSLVYFCGDFKTAHMVNLVESGKRFNWVLFFKERK